MGEIFEIELVPVYEMRYIEESNWGAYACETTEGEKVELSKYGNFVITGVMPQLFLGLVYKAKIQEKTSKRFGTGYEIKAIRQEIPTTIESQHKYFKAILTKLQAESIIEAYPNEDIIKLMKNDQFDYNKVNGIGEKSYPKIKEKVLDSIEIQKALTELSDFGVTYKMIKKMLEKYNSPELLVQKVTKNPYVLTEVDGLGFLKVDHYALKMGIPNDSPHRIYSAIDYLLKQAEQEGHSWVAKNNIIEKATNLLIISENKIKQYIEDSENDIEDSENDKDDLKDNDKDDLIENDLYIEGDKIALSRNRYYEEQIAEHINELNNAENRFFVPDIDEKIKEVEKEFGFQLTDEQKKAIHMAYENSVLIISGKAGVGKSTILKAILDVIGYHYETCALSGKASQRLEEIGLKSKTIHRLLDYSPFGGFSYRKGFPIPTDIIVLDEASMVNSQIFYQLVSAIDKDSKLIIIGDIEQLPPIGAGNVFKDMIESQMIPTIELTQVHRQAKKSGVLVSANKIREGKQITPKDFSGYRVIGELKDLHLLARNSSQQIFNDVINASKRYKGNIMDFQVIVPMKKRGLLSTSNLNIELQKIFNPENKPFVKYGKLIFKIGDKVIKNGNDYVNSVFNGTLGIIDDVNQREDYIVVKFMDKTYVTYKRSDFNQIELAYALTIHRIQGSQFKFVVMAVDWASYIMLSRQLVYTGITRVQNKMILTFENKAIQYAINHNNSAKRNTFLVNFLKN